MTDSSGVLQIKQELDTCSSVSTATSSSSPISANNKLNVSLNRSNSYSSSNNTSSGNSAVLSGHKSSPSVSPDRQLCSSTTTLTSDLNSVSICSDGFANANSTTSGANASSNNGAGSSSIRDELRRLCLVCGDIASGFHYGVASCEACKAFFKRTIQGNIEYTCPASNECEINKRRRKACQACRFQKCLLMGMLKEGVRLDRVRGGRQKYRRNPVTNSYQTMQQLYQSGTTSLEDVKMLEMLNSYEPDIITVQQLTHTNSNDDANQLSLIQVKIEGASVSGLYKRQKSSGSACIFQNNNCDAHEIICVLSDLYDKELVSVIGWAKQIPGFTELPLNDQMKLLQVSWPEILTLQLCFRSLPFNGKLCFATDVWMDELLSKECGYVEFYYHCVQIAQRLERLSARREEYYLLKALLLSNCDILLDDQSSLRAFRDTILNALNDVVYLLRHSAAVSHQQQLLLLLPSLRQADGILRRFWRKISQDGAVSMKKLFVEMLEPVSR